MLRNNPDAQPTSLTSAEALPFHKYVVAGGVAGLCEVLVMYPLDVVKTRFQLQRAGADGKVMYNSVTDAFSKIMKQEGYFSLYRGIISPILAEAPKRAVKFSVNEEYKKFFSNSKGELKIQGAIAAGVSAGLTEAFVNCPFEVVKVRMQARENLGVYKNTMDALMKMLRGEGALSLYRGLEPQLWRNGVWNGAYFGTINELKAALPKPKDKVSETWRNFFAGLMAGGLATTLNTPFDVVKSRMQNQVATEVPKYSWTLPALGVIYKEEGFKALFKGYVPRMIRLGPGGGIMLVAFDFVSDLLR